MLTRIAAVSLAGLLLSGCARQEADRTWTSDELSRAALAGIERKQEKLRTEGPKSFDRPAEAHEFFLAQRQAPGQEYPTELPADPLHGLPFAYRLVEGDPHGRQYVLYSVGLDGTDEGGAHPQTPAEGRAALSDSDALGLDVVINRPPELDE